MMTWLGPLWGEESNTPVALMREMTSGLIEQSIISLKTSEWTETYNLLINEGNGWGIRMPLAVISPPEMCLLWTPKSTRYNWICYSWQTPYLQPLHRINSAKNVKISSIHDWESRRRVVPTVDWQALSTGVGQTLESGNGGRFDSF